MAALTSRLMTLAMLGLNSQYFPRMVQVAAAAVDMPVGDVGKLVRRLTDDPQVLTGLLSLVGGVTEGDTIDSVLLRIASDPVQGPAMDELIQGAVLAMKSADNEGTA